MRARLLSLLALARAFSATCFVPPSPPLNTLLNNTRLNYKLPPPTPYPAVTPDLCLANCVADPLCGGMVFQEAYEPLPAGGCGGKVPCCYPAPIVPPNGYEVFGPGSYASFGFVSAVVRYGPPAPPVPPSGVPRSWVPTYNMNASISLYWRNATGIEPAEYYDGYVSFEREPPLRTKNPAPKKQTLTVTLHPLNPTKTGPGDV
jgi:hypothetical protein